jgi:hypothetical protein
MIKTGIVETLCINTSLPTLIAFVEVLFAYFSRLSVLEFELGNLFQGGPTWAKAADMKIYIATCWMISNQSIWRKQPKS